MKIKPSDLLWLRYNASNDQAGGQSDQNTPANTQGSDQQQNPPAQQTGDTSGTSTDKSKEKLHTQSEVNALIEDRLKRDREKAKQDKLKEDQKFKELSESQEAQIRDWESKHTTATEQVKTLTDQIGEYEKVVSALVKDQVKALPAPVQKLLEKYSPLEQLDWLNTEGKKMGTTGTKIEPIPGSPKPNSDTNAGGKCRIPITRHASPDVWARVTCTQSALDVIIGI